MNIFSDILYRLGIVLISVAGFFVMIGFFMFILVAGAIMLPGLALYSLAVRMKIREIQDEMRDQDIYDENGMKVIDGERYNKEADFGNKAKDWFKNILRKFRNFLDRFVD
mgnify:CR=1 FL=1